MKRLILSLVTVLSFSVLGFSSSAQTSSDMEKVGRAKLALATVMIEAFDNGSVCDAEAYPSEINKVIESARLLLGAQEIENWEKTVSKASKLREDFKFRQIMNPVDLEGQKLAKAAIEKQLVGAKFYKFGRGAYGSPQNILFQLGGAAKIRDMKLLDQDPYFEWVETTVPWEVVIVKTSFGEVAKIKIAGVIYEFQTQFGEVWIIPEGTLENEIPQKALTTTDSYCDA